MQFTPRDHHLTIRDGGRITVKTDDPAEYIRRLVREHCAPRMLELQNGWWDISPTITCNMQSRR